MWFFMGLVVGAFVGWNMPQPSWAKYVQSRIQDALTKNETTEK